jgi:hypothetical protein
MHSSCSTACQFGICMRREQWITIQLATLVGKEEEEVDKLHH